jgi:hypothetical protein
MIALRLLLLVTALASSGCAEELDTPTSASDTGPTSVLFVGTLQPRSSRFYSYTLTSAGQVTAMLASLEQGQMPMPNMLELGLGVPAGTGCAVQVVRDTRTSLVPQIKQDAAAGTYCVRIADTQGLPTAMNFTIRVLHP